MTLPSDQKPVRRAIGVFVAVLTLTVILAWAAMESAAGPGGVLVRYGPAWLLGAVTGALLAAAAAERETPVSHLPKVARRSAAWVVGGLALALLIPIVAGPGGRLIAIAAASGFLLVTVAWAVVIQMGRDKRK